MSSYYQLRRVTLSISIAFCALTTISWASASAPPSDSQRTIVTDEAVREGAELALPIRHPSGRIILPGPPRGPDGPPTPPNQEDRDRFAQMHALQTTILERARVGDVDGAWATALAWGQQREPNAQKAELLAANRLLVAGKRALGEGDTNTAAAIGIDLRERLEGAITRTRQRRSPEQLSFLSADGSMGSHRGFIATTGTLSQSSVPWENPDSADSFAQTGRDSTDLGSHYMALGRVHEMLLNEPDDAAMLYAEARAQSPAKARGATHALQQIARRKGMDGYRAAERAIPDIQSVRAGTRALIQRSVESATDE